MDPKDPHHFAGFWSKAFIVETAGSGEGSGLFLWTKRMVGRPLFTCLVMVVVPTSPVLMGVGGWDFYLSNDGCDPYFSNDGGGPLTVRW